MPTATDAGVRSGKTSTEMMMFLIGGVMVLANGSDFVNVPWEVMTSYLALAGMGIGARALQKTVATYQSAKAPATEGENRREPTV